MEAFNLTVINLKNVIFFILPGVIFISLFFYQIPDRKKSDFRIIIWSVVTSALINFGITLFLRIIDYKIDDLYIFAVAIAYSILIAMLAADFVRSKHFVFLNKKLFGIEYYPFGRVWNAFFEVKKLTVFKITLQNGLSYIGILKRASIDPSDEIQEFEIYNVYAYDTETTAFTRIKETESMLIRSDAILSVEKIEENSARELYEF